MLNQKERKNQGNYELLSILEKVAEDKLQHKYGITLIVVLLEKV